MLSCFSKAFSHGFPFRFLMGPKGLFMIRIDPKFRVSSWLGPLSCHKGSHRAIKCISNPPPPHIRHCSEGCFRHGCGSGWVLPRSGSDLREKTGSGYDLREKNLIRIRPSFASQSRIRTYLENRIRISFYFENRIRIRTPLFEGRSECAKLV